MNVVSKSSLVSFCRGHANAVGPMDQWYKEARGAENFNSFADVKAKFPSVDSVGELLVFNVAGNNFRIVCNIRYGRRIMFIRWVGTHAEYDRQDVSKL